MFNCMVQPRPSISTSLSVKVCSGVESAHVLLSEEPSPLTIYDIVLFAKSSTEILFGRTPSSTKKVEHDLSARPGLEIARDRYDPITPVSNDRLNWIG